MLGRADERGVDVRGLVWRSHKDAFGFTARENRQLGRELQRRGAEALLDMRVRLGGSHHQKMRRDPAPRRPDPRRRVRRRDRPVPLPPRRRRPRAATRRRSRTWRRSTATNPPWHDVQAAISGPGGLRRGDGLPRALGGPDPADPQPVAAASRTGSAGWTRTPDPLPEQAPPPPPVEGGTHVVQLLRTYPNLRLRPRLPVRPRRRAQRRPRLHQGGGEGAAADLRRGPVPLGPPRRRDLHRGAARPPRPARDRAWCRCAPT